MILILRVAPFKKNSFNYFAVMWKFHCFNGALKLAVAKSRNRNVKIVEVSFKTKIL